MKGYTSQANILATKRIEYIDALRGFTMILVVLWHVAHFGFDISKEAPSFHHYLQQIRMPMFFFISGFVMFKKETVWNLVYVFAFLKKKFPIQIITTSIFFLAFVYAHSHFLPDLTSGFYAGYWFTVTLFIFYILYSLLRLLFKRGEDYVILTVGFLFFFVIRLSIIVDILSFLPKDIRGVLCMRHWWLFLFFILGTLAKKYFVSFQKVIDHNAILLVCIILYFGLNRLGCQPPFNEGFPHAGIKILATFSGVVLLFSFFRKKQNLFTKEKVLGRSLQYIGRRTLDIYLIHYFLLPYQLPKLVTVFHDYPMPVLEFTATLFISIIVIAISLLIGNIFRLSPFIAHYLFGAKDPVPETLSSERNEHKWNNIDSIGKTM